MIVAFIYGTLLLQVVISTPITQDLSYGRRGDLEARHPLMKRDLKDDICGVLGNQQAPVDKRTEDTWKSYNIDDWLIKATTPYSQRGWFYNDTAKSSNDPSKQYKDWQSWLWAVAGPEGHDKCPPIGNNCDLALSFELCNRFPEAHSVIWATEHFAGNLTFLKSQWDTNRDLIDGITGNLKDWFFSPRPLPTKMIMPISIVGGVFAIITSLGGLNPWFGVAAIGAGIASIITGILTQDSLTLPDPLDIWSAVQPKATELWASIIGALQMYYNKMLSGPLPIDLSSLDDDPLEMPAILKNGAFATQKTVDLFDPKVKGSLAAAAINAFWIEDRVVIIKLTDQAWGRGTGQACKAQPDVLFCDSRGVAWLFVKWLTKETIIPQQGQGGQKPFDPAAWHVWGAYEAGKKIEDKANANHLKDFGLDMGMIALKAEKIQDEHGFLYQGIGEDLSKKFQNRPGEVKFEDLITFNMPVCDIERIMRNNGYDHMHGPVWSENPWKIGIPCTCLKQQGWPKDKYPISDKDVEKSAGTKVCNGWWLKPGQS